MSNDIRLCLVALLISSSFIWIMLLIFAMQHLHCIRLCFGVFSSPFDTGRLVGALYACSWSSQTARGCRLTCFCCVLYAERHLQHCAQNKSLLLTSQPSAVSTDGNPAAATAVSELIVQSCCELMMGDSATLATAAQQALQVSWLTLFLCFLDITHGTEGTKRNHLITTLG